MLLIAGLGNPGPQYARSRHNAGFEVVRALAERVHAPLWRDKFHGEFTRTSIGDHDVVLLRPMTYMNESGRSVQAAMAFFKIEPQDLVVVHDELDLPFGSLRLKMGGGHAGHNGLRSIFQYLSTGEFARLRVGIGRPPAGWTGDVADFVLAEMSGVDREEFGDIAKKGAASLLMMCDKGFTAAMNALNKKPKPPKPPKPEPGAEPGPEPGDQGTAQK